jgi:DNA-directed RNA polymerase subunit N (RpoN/RPB10)
MTIRTKPLNSIPVTCITCGNILTRQYSYYIYKLKNHKSSVFTTMGLHRAARFEHRNSPDIFEQRTLDDADLQNPCCRRHIYYLAKKNL